MSIYITRNGKDNSEMDLGADKRRNALRTHGKVQIVVVVGIELDSMGGSKRTFFCMISDAGR